MIEVTMKQRKLFPVIGIVMLGIVMRAPFTAVPTILTDIAQGLGVSVSELGILTSIPLLMFALCSSSAPFLARKLGVERLMALVLLTMGMGSAVRILNLPSLYLGTVLIGGATAMINVLLPSLVAKYFPRKIGFYTTVYVTIMGISATLASMVAVPIVAASSWTSFLLLLSAVVFLAFLLWLPNLVSAKEQDEPTVRASNQPSLWKNKGALLFLAFGGLQSLLFYTEIAWLPTIAQDAGLSQADAGLLTGLYNFIGLPVSMLVPEWINRLQRSHRAHLIAFFSALTLVGLVMMLLAPSHFGVWLLIHLLLGISSGALFPYMMLNFSLKTSSSQATAQLSGMVQTGGYVIAALGPVLLGYSYSLFASWHPLIWALFGLTLIMIWAVYQIELEDKII